MSWFPSVHLSLSLSLELETHMSDCFLIIPLWGQTGLRGIANSYVENGTPESCSPYLLHLTSILVHSNTIPSAAQSQNPGVSLNPSLSHTPHPICQKTLSAFKICVKADHSSHFLLLPLLPKPLWYFPDYCNICLCGNLTSALPHCSLFSTHYPECSINIWCHISAQLFQSWSIMLRLGADRRHHIMMSFHGIQATTMICPCCITNLSSYHSPLSYFCSSLIGILDVLSTCQASFCLRIFALGIFACLSDLVL